MKYRWVSLSSSICSSRGADTYHTAPATPRIGHAAERAGASATGGSRHRDLVHLHARAARAIDDEDAPLARIGELLEDVERLLRRLEGGQVRRGDDDDGVGHVERGEDLLREARRRVDHDVIGLHLQVIDGLLHRGHRHELRALGRIAAGKYLDAAAVLREVALEG